MMWIFEILNYGNVRRKKKPKTLMSYHRNVDYIKGTSQQNKRPISLIQFLNHKEKWCWVTRFSIFNF